jgi:Raf kinase inhibitor-like YbhB/YbcL family protein
MMAAMRRLALALFLVAPAALLGCGGGGGGGAATDTPAAPATLRLSSPAFADGARIPTPYTCSGTGRRPALRWSGVPQDARELALVVIDPDAGGGGFVHWTAYAIPPSTRGLPSNGLPAGALEGANSAGSQGWTGPCPPPGDSPHHYNFTLYWLKRPSGLKAGASGDAVLAAVRSRAGGRGRLVGRFSR